MRSLLEDPRPAAGTPTSLPRRRAPQEGAPKSVEKLPFLKSCGQDDGAEGTTADDGQRVEQAARTDQQRGRNDEGSRSDREPARDRSRIGLGVATARLTGAAGRPPRPSLLPTAGVPAGRHRRGVPGPLTAARIMKAV